jgi:hypothetical protein
VFVVEPKTCAKDKQEYSCDKEPEQHCDPSCRALHVWVRNESKVCDPADGCDLHEWLNK